VEASDGDRVYAATVAQGGGLRVRAEEVGEDTTFGRVIRMVEEAEAHRGVTQRWADQFSGYYLPVVGLVALGTYWVQQDVMTTIAVLVVACSCAFALATPVAMLAAIGTAARDGLLIKGGKYLEALAQADVLLLDKTGTLTLGTPRITQVTPLNGVPEQEVLRLAASAERFSEHPLADAVRDAAAARELALSTPEDFEAIPGQGIRAAVEGRTVTVGNRTLVAGAGEVLTQDGETPLFVAIDGVPAGVLLATDTVREGVAEALAAVRRRGLTHIELLTGDTAPAAAALAEKLDIDFQAELLPEDKIDAVKAHQAEGRTVVMIGDGVNDAPALAQADAGIAMGGVGTDVAIDAAHVVLMREDWALVPRLVQTADRTLGVVKSNLVLTALYNGAALSLAALGWLPPVIAAALHALPDLGILANSSRLLRR
jgi:heavy metal translocating P-type ATPase